MFAAPPENGHNPLDSDWIYRPLGARQWSRRPAQSLCRARQHAASMAFSASKLATPRTDVIKFAKAYLTSPSTLPLSLPLPGGAETVGNQIVADQLCERPRGTILSWVNTIYLQISTHITVFGFLNCIFSQLTDQKSMTILNRSK